MKRAFTHNEKVAAVYGAMAVISSIESMPEEIGILYSQRAISLMKKAWDEIPQDILEAANGLLEVHGKVQEEQRAKREQYLKRAAN